MKLMLSLLVAAVLSSCVAEENGQAARQDEEKRKDPVAGVAANVGGMRERNDSGFAAGADAIP